ncbi:hypothetical protein [Novosphingobium humi]|uniref:RNA helicase n=1 Tax=Novosphingobium humi TaxID=2282397 RepID=A0ABY7TZC4_9SPHN|nr:hypothetical protein [Novosphingobium humi]WCT78646.1 hypothetical protein PQ457_06700 [Novosphingobium humi]
MTQNKGKGIAAAVAAEEAEGGESKPVCGIIMPISAMPPKYDTTHWNDVRRVINKAAEDAGMRPQIVSDDFESDVIQSRIIRNLYYNPVVVCDVSGLNPNVMFELGIRITFKKPVVIITDDVGNIPFDTRVIEHLHYPSGLHIHETNQFIEKLTIKIKNLHESFKQKTFKSFIEDFGTFEILEPKQQVVGFEKLILDRLASLESVVRSGANRASIARNLMEPRHPNADPSGKLERVSFRLNNPSDGNSLSRFTEYLKGMPWVENAGLLSDGSVRYSNFFVVDFNTNIISRDELISRVFSHAPEEIRKIIFSSEVS